jgi:hypothetical protein
VVRLSGPRSGRRWLVATDLRQAAGAVVAGLRGLGANDVFVVAGAEGTGPAPDVPSAVVGVRGEGMMGAIRAAEGALSALPADIVAQIDAWDPARKARVVRSLFSDDRAVAGRQAWGGRPAAWRAIEDKTTIDALWDALGVPRAPSTVVPADPGALLAAHAALDAGDGTVWAADNRHGWHGGATGVRWVNSAAAAADAAAFMTTEPGFVRVMPFVEGVPCSIHGVVTPTASGGLATLALRPCEMIVLRGAGGRFHYAQVATFWDPPPADRAALRALARRVGRALHARVGYRGVFTIDGVMGADGFVPTELNPRYGGAISRMSTTMPDLPLYLLHLAIAEGVPVPFDAEALEAWIVAEADAHRAGGAMAVVPRPVAPATLALVRDGGAWRDARDGEAPHATARLGPSPTGGVVLVSFDGGYTPVGPPAGPRAVEVLTALDARLGLGLGPLAAARDVR